MADSPPRGEGAWTHETRAAAGVYAELGLAVVPLHRCIEPGVCSCRAGRQCATPGKHPRILWKRRPAEPPWPAELDRWWRDWPDSRVGAILGDRFCALDVDEHGDHGLDELADLESTFGPLPTTWRALTPSGGLHAWFALSGEVASTTHPLRPGVQLRAGRHVMAMPPSDGRQWEVNPGESALAALPPWVPQYLRASNPNGRSGYLPIPQRLGAGLRHNTYASAARSMARAGFPYEAIVAALIVTDSMRADPPKDDREEFERIAEWACAAQADAERVGG
jgi:putative DNA primase/helicase